MFECLADRDRFEYIHQGRGQDFRQGAGNRDIYSLWGCSKTKFLRSEIKNVRPNPLFRKRTSLATPNKLTHISNLIFG